MPLPGVPVSEAHPLPVWRGDTGRAVMGTCCSACSGLSSAGQGGLHASSSEVPALPGEVLALLITSIHLRRGFGTVRTGTRPPPTADWEVGVL